MNKNRSFLWKIPSEQFRQVIEESTTWSEVSQYFYGKETNLRTIKTRVKQENIDTSHFLGRSKYKGKKCKHNSHPKYKIEELLQKNPNHKIPNQRLKTKLLEKCMLVEQCYTCGLRSSWNKKPLTLQLVHLDGDSYNNQLQNIILQCPNCFSQLKTGSNIIFLESCVKCGGNAPAGAKNCAKCKSSRSPRCPSKETLQRELVAIDFEGVQRKYGVTKNTIISWINL